MSNLFIESIMDKFNIDLSDIKDDIYGKNNGSCLLICKQLIDRISSSKIMDDVRSLTSNIKRALVDLLDLKFNNGITSKNIKWIYGATRSPMNGDNTIFIKDSVDITNCYFEYISGMCNYINTIDFDNIIIGTDSYEMVLNALYSTEKSDYKFTTFELFNTSENNNAFPKLDNVPITASNIRISKALDNITIIDLLFSKYIDRMFDYCNELGEEIIDGINDINLTQTAVLLPIKSITCFIGNIMDYALYTIDKILNVLDERTRNDMKPDMKIEPIMEKINEFVIL